MNWSQLTLDVRLSDLAGATTVDASLLKENKKLIYLMLVLHATRDECVSFINEQF